MKSISQFLQFFKEVKIEMAKVNWPSFNEWVGSTIIVLIIMVAFSIYLGLVDYGFHWLVFEKILSFS
jgi:preprotein translocase subunit SecE